MKCPYCGHMASKVIDSRTSDDGVRRRRECQACSERYTTYEQFQRSVVMVTRQPSLIRPTTLVSGMRTSS